MPELPAQLLGYSEEPLAKMEPHARALLIAAYLCDVKKVQEEPRGTNRGPWIDEFLKSANTNVGQPWCAAFVTYCALKAGIPRTRLPIGPAAVSSWRSWAKRTNRWDNDPERGELFVLASSHIGFVTRTSGGIAFTIEGNTNDEGSREGYEVCRRERPVSTIEGFISLRNL